MNIEQNTIDFFKWLPSWSRDKNVMALQHWSNNTLDRTISPIKIEAIFSLRNFTSGAPKSWNQYGRGIEKIVWQLFPCTVPKIFEAVTDYLNDVGKNACLFMDWSENSKDCDERTWIFRRTIWRFWNISGRSICKTTSRNDAEITVNILFSISHWYTHK